MPGEARPNTGPSGQPSGEPPHSPGQLVWAWARCIGVSGCSAFGLIPIVIIMSLKYVIGFVKPRNRAPRRSVASAAVAANGPPPSDWVLDQGLFNWGNSVQCLTDWVEMGIKAKKPGGGAEE